MMTSHPLGAIVDDDLWNLELSFNGYMPAKCQWQPVCCSSDAFYAMCMAYIGSLAQVPWHAVGTTGSRSLFVRVTACVLAGNFVVRDCLAWFCHGL